MPQAVCWNHIYRLDAVGPVDQDVDLKAIHPDASLDNYTFLVTATFINADPGTFYMHAIKSEYRVRTIAGNMAIPTGGYSAASPERYGATATAIDMTESIVSNKLRITITINTGVLPTRGHLFIEVKASPDPSP